VGKGDIRPPPGISFLKKKKKKNARLTHTYRKTKKGHKKKKDRIRGSKVKKHEESLPVERGTCENRCGDFLKNSIPAP